MKQIRKAVIAMFVLSVLLIHGSLCANASSRTNNIYKTMKAGQTIHGDCYSHTYDSNYNSIETYTYYSFSIPAAGIVTFSVNDNVYDIIFFDSKHKPKYGDDAYHFVYFRPSSAKDKKVLALDKGTYYLRLNNYSGDANQGSVKFTYKKGIFKSNYSPAKAINLKKNKTVTIAQTKKNHYYRWYKIVLTKKQAITFYTNDGDRVSLFDDDMNDLDIERAGSQSSKYFTSKKHPKGTYYVRITYGNPSGGGDYITFKWK